MTKIINKIFVVLAFAVIAYGAFSYFAQPVSIIETAHAAFGGESGNGGCCGGGNEGGGGNQGGDDKTHPPVCVYIKANKNSLPAGGGNVNLTWSTSRALSATLSPSGESVAVNGSKTVAVTKNTTFVLNIKNGDGTDSCQVKVTVAKELPNPVCDSFKATPNTLPYGGGQVVLSWATTNADDVSINQGIGAVSADGTKEVIANENKTYTLTAKGNGKTVQCQTEVKIDSKPVSACTLTASPIILTKGESSTLNWTSSNVTEAVIDQGVGTVNLNGTTVVSPLETTTYTFTGRTNGADSIQCPVTITVKDIPEEKECKLQITKSVNTHEAKIGDELTYTINVKNIGNGDCTGGGVKIVDVHDTGLKFISETHSDNLSAGYNTVPLYTEGSRTLNWNGHTLTPGEEGSITWVGKVKEREQCGNFEVLNKAQTTAFELDNFQTWVYSNLVKTTVNNQCVEPGAPVCDSFTATPNSFNNGVGGGVTLTWATTNADSVTIDQGIGAVAVDGSTGTSVTDNTTFTLTAVKGDKSASCPVTVTVTDPETPSLSCDSFTASPNSLPRGGGNTTLTWATTNATDVSINNGVGTVSVDGSRDVTVTADTTFTLTLRDAQGNTKSCDATVGVATGGGGGGSSSPRCELTISDTKIKSGEEVTITWDNTRTNEMVLKDNRGNVLVDTEKTSKYDEDEGSIKVKPTRDTEYTMTVSRGSRDRVCRVKVELEDEVTVISTRTQTPQVAGIALTQVPYTGFEAGPFLTFLFYTLLAIWAAFIAYMIVVKERSVAGITFGGAKEATNTTSPAEWEALVDQMHDVAEKVDTGIVATTATAPFISPVKNTDGTPANLPTGEAPVMGYKSLVENIAPVAEEEMDDMTELENAAHEKQALLSSDAINYFMNTYADLETRVEALTATIEQAKGQFPSEGGWMVLNLARVQELNTVSESVAKPATTFTPNTRVGVSSLAEAMVTGNVAAAYEMIGNRPMFALADAAADLDAVYRARKGIDTDVSSLLATATAKLSDEQIETMIKALTSALDGAYTDEQSAVKMAIMKAIKIAG